jgi:hypothetical protein
VSQTNNCKQLISLSNNCLVGQSNKQLQTIVQSVKTNNCSFSQNKQLFIQSNNWSWSVSQTNNWSISQTND